MSIATGILFGLAPATRATRVDLWPALKYLGSLPSRGRGLGPGKVLAVFQVALSLVLLIGAGLFARSLQRLNGENFGTSRESVLIVRVEPKGSDQRNIPGTTARLDRVYRELLERVEEVPGVNCQEATREELVDTLRVTLAEALDFNRADARSAADHDFEEIRIAV